VELRLELRCGLLGGPRIELDLTDKARDYFADRGYDPVYGARPLKRMIQRELETALGRKLLAGEIRDGSRVKVDAGARGLEFESHAAKSAA
jgi:ATP-dependent Clp protease ATP-binding subunit ClpB